MIQYTIALPKRVKDETLLAATIEQGTRAINQYDLYRLAQRPIQQGVFVISQVRTDSVELHQEPPAGLRGNHPRSTARTLLKYVGTWVGEDLERCLQEVYSTRQVAEF